MHHEELARLRFVLSTLAKHGLGGVLCTVGFGWCVPFFSRRSTLPSDLPQRLTLAFEELGGAYLKFGQMLSLRPDLIPQEYCDSFSKLLDCVPPEQLDTICLVIEHEFKRPFTELFSHIDPLPLGSASVAQVHKARLKNGKAVAIKIQRPATAQQFLSDISVLRFIAAKLNNHFSELQVQRIVEEFERYTKEELNFVAEANHLEDIRLATHISGIVIPRVYWEYTTEKILTMDYLAGEKLSASLHVHKPAIARLLIDALLEQVFILGKFHADLHLGNILLLGPKQIGLIDFGIVGVVDEQTRLLGLQLYLAIIERNTTRITQTLLSYGTPSAKTDNVRFGNSVELLVSSWWNSNPSQRRVTHLMHNLFTLCSKHAILLPQDTVLLGKALLTAESTARVLDPSFNFVAYSQPKIKQLLLHHRTPKKIITQFSLQSKNFIESLSQLPTQALKTVASIQNGNLSVMLKDNQFRHLGQDVNLSSNRLSFALVCAALIVASALLIQIGPKIGTYSIISSLCLAGALFFIFLLFVSIVREHNPKYDSHDPL